MVSLTSWASLAAHRRGQRFLRHRDPGITHVAVQVRAPACQRECVPQACLHAHVSDPLRISHKVSDQQLKHATTSLRSFHTHSLTCTCLILLRKFMFPKARLPASCSPLCHACRTWPSPSACHSRVQGAVALHSSLQ